MRRAWLLLQLLLLVQRCTTQNNIIILLLTLWRTQMTRMRVGTKIDTISIYLSWNWVNQITISKIYQQRTLQGGTIVTSWGQEYKFFQKRCKKFGFYKKPKFQQVQQISCNLWRFRGYKVRIAYKIHQLIMWMQNVNDICFTCLNFFVSITLHILQLRFLYFCIFFYNYAVMYIL